MIISIFGYENIKQLLKYFSSLRFSSVSNKIVLEKIHFKFTFQEEWFYKTLVIVQAIDYIPKHIQSS